MGRTAKIILGVLAGFALVCVVSGVLGMRYARDRGRAFLEETARTERAARAWAEGRAGAECVDEGMRRTFACQGVVCQAEQQLFVGTCLQVATPTPELCEGVPPAGSFLASAQWRSSRCMVYTTGDQAQRCQNLLGAVQQHCERVRYRLPLPGATPPTGSGAESAAPTPSAPPAPPAATAAPGAPPATATPPAQ